MSDVLRGRSPVRMKEHFSVSLCVRPANEFGLESSSPMELPWISRRETRMYVGICSNMGRSSRKIKPVSLVVLPPICEHKEFCSEHDYHIPEFTYSSPRHHEEELIAEEQPLLQSSNEQWKPKRSLRRRKLVQTPKPVKGWKMEPKKKVKTAWAIRHRLKSTMKAPLLLWRTIRDGYVRVMRRMERKLNQNMSYLSGVRIM